MEDKRKYRAAKVITRRGSFWGKPLLFGKECLHFETGRIVKFHDIEQIWFDAQTMWAFPTSQQLNSWPKGQSTKRVRRRAAMRKKARIAEAACAAKAKIEHPWKLCRKAADRQSN